jgi:hypothetical protein
VVWKIFSIFKLELSSHCFFNQLLTLITFRGVSRSAEPPPPIFPKKYSRRRDGENFKNFQAAAADKK